MTRKIFIDGGANHGQSTDVFLRSWPDAHEYEIFMFEVDHGSLSIIKNRPWISRPNITLIESAIWTDDGVINFYQKRPGSGGNTLLLAKVEQEKKQKPELAHVSQRVSCLRLATWMIENFNKNDHIILKLDIEGAEYDVIDDLKETSAINMVNTFFLEIHGAKCKKTFEESEKLIDIIEEASLVPYEWDGNTFNYRKHHLNVYTKERLRHDYKKWERRGITCD